jgi:hypothetical protein
VHRSVQELFRVENRCIWNFRRLWARGVSGAPKSKFSSHLDSWDRFAKDTSIKRPALLCLNGGQNIRLIVLRLINPPGVFVVVNDGTRTATLSRLKLMSKQNPVRAQRPRNYRGVGQYRSATPSCYDSIAARMFLNINNYLTYRQPTNHLLQHCDHP